MTDTNRAVFSGSEASVHRYSKKDGTADFFTVTPGNEALWDEHSLRSWSVAFGPTVVRLRKDTSDAEVHVSGVRFVVRRTKAKSPPFDAVEVSWTAVQRAEKPARQGPRLPRRKGYETPEVLRARLVRDFGDDFVAGMLERTMKNKDLARLANVTTSCICGWRKKITEDS